MSIVTYPDGRVFEIADGDVDLAEYYRGEGATISGDLAAVKFPRVYDGGDTYVGEDVPAVDVPEAGSVALSDAASAAKAANADLQTATDDLTSVVGPTLYRHVGGAEVDAAAWPDSGQVNTAGEKLYTFVGDKVPGDANGASEEWVVDTADVDASEKSGR